MKLGTERPRIDPAPPESLRLNGLERVIAITRDDQGSIRTLIHARNNPDGTMVLRITPDDGGRLDLKVYIDERKVFP